MSKKGLKIIQKGILGHLGRVFLTYAREEKDVDNNIYKDSEKGGPSVPTLEGYIDYEIPVPSVPMPTRDCFEGILSMPLSEFKKAGLLVRVWCQHLNGEEIYMASTAREAATGRSEGLVVYTADELIRLVKGKPDSDELRIIHAAKKILQGVLIETKEREGNI